MSLLDSDTKSVGDAEAGVRWTRRREEHAIRVDCWGFWPSETAESFAQETVSACRSVGAPFHLLFDASDLKPQGDEGQSAIRRVMLYLATAEVASAVVCAGNVLTRMQLARLANEAGLSSVIAFKDTPPSPWPSPSNR